MKVITQVMKPMDFKFYLYIFLQRNAVMAQIFQQEKEEDNPVAQQKEKDEAAKDMEV